MQDRPNIVYILADDMGYGDLSCLNGESKLHTEHMDRLAREGMIFTDAHAGSAVCTPTRYGILTGRYCWRTRLKSGVLYGYSPPLIAQDRLTVASLLKQHGYTTACIGKWHLGLEWSKAGEAPEEVDFTKPLLDGPTTHGFDTSFIISASLDMAPYVYIEDDRVRTLPNRITANDDRMQFWREGPTGADFEHIGVLPKLTEKAVAFIDAQARSVDGQPFFLYFPLPAPHTPILPTEEFQGKSETNAYGDFVLQVDWTVGQVMEALERNGLAENTLFIMTSDNGCSPRADVEELAEFGHHPSYHFRGYKADIFEGGHRIPFIARWPGKIPADSVSDEIICLTDLMATGAAIVGAQIPDNAGEDSYNLLPTLLDKPYEKPIREATVHHSINGSLSIRQGKWKLELCPDSGGWSYPRPGQVEGLPPIQLYDMETDVGERRNVYAEHPEVVEHLTALLTTYIKNGRSTPGAPQENDGPSFWKQLRWMDDA